MMTPQKQENLDNLRLLAEIAGDDYYFKMKKDDFDSAMKGDENELFYQYYLQQREKGFEAFQHEVGEQIKAITSAEELHFLIACHNYDGNQWLLKQVIENPNCAVQTAKIIYWLSGADYLYKVFGGLEQVPTDNISFTSAELLQYIERKINNNGFKNDETLEIPELDDYIDFSDLDFSQQPFVNIPKELRY